MAKTAKERQHERFLEKSASDGHLPLRKVAECMETCGLTSHDFTIGGVKYTVKKEA